MHLHVGMLQCAPSPQLVCVLILLYVSVYILYFILVLDDK